jgi:hypothetical protein
MYAEYMFADVIRPRSSLQRDFSWLSKCEALMINLHHRMQKAGLCCKTHHGTTWVCDYTNVGLSEYLLALVVLWPCLAICSSFQYSHCRRDVLEDSLFGWLTSNLADPHMRILDRTMTCGLRSITNWPGCVTSLSDECACLRDYFIAYPQSSLAYTLGEGRIVLFHHLLNCGIDPNYQSRRSMHRRRFEDKCRRSVWQSWLRAVYLDLETEQRMHPAGLGSMRNDARRNVRDLVAICLRHGADPDCFVCVSRYHSGGACRLETLESVLATITPQDSLSRLRALRTTYLT